MKLALRLGRTLHELAHSMSAHEFGLWAALHERDPWDETRTDYQAALVCSTVANWSGRMLREGAKPMTPCEFMPFLKHDEPTTSQEPGDPMEHFYEMAKKT